MNEIDQMDLTLRIQKGDPLLISWTGTRWTTILSAVLILIFNVFLLSLLTSAPGRIKPNMIVGAVLGVILLGMTVYQLLFSSVVTLEGKTLFIKKLFGPEVAVDVHQVTVSSAFSLRRTAYTTIRYPNADGTTAKALILNSKSPIWGVETPAGEVIQLAQTLV